MPHLLCNAALARRCCVIVLAVSGTVLSAQMQSPRYQSPGVQSTLPSAPSALPVTPAITPNGAVVEDVVARVNDQIISRSDLERAQQMLQQEIKQTGATADAEDRQQNLLRDLIDQQLLLSRGKELNINADTEVLRRLDEIRKQNHLDSMDDLEKAVRQQGLSYEDYRASLRNNVITSNVVRDEVGRRLQMTRSDEVKYYEAHKDQFKQPEQIRLSEILVPTAAGADDTAVAAAQAKADAIETRLKGGEKFADVAKASSGGPTASQGGELGLFKRGGLAQVLEDKTFPLKAGEFTEPIRTRQGFVILQVTEHQDAGVPPLEQVEGPVQEAMYSEQMAPALRAYLTHLREDAYIDIKPGFVDSGASSKETKPVFTAYQPPPPKKKKAEKQRFDRGGRFSTAAGAAAATPVATPAVVQLGKNGKPKKIKREKIRYGQAPRVTLPAAPEGTESASGTPTVQDAGGAAPGTALAPVDSSNTVNAAQNDADPLTPKAPEKSKTRYSARAATIKQDKAAAVSKKAALKAAATPTPVTTEEQQTQKTQAAPLGLNGDTVKKVKKKRQKGEAKERLQGKEVQRTAPLQANPMPDKKTGLPPATKQAPADQEPTAGDKTPLSPGNTAAPGSTQPTPDNSVTQPPAQPSVPPQ